MSELKVIKIELNNHGKPIASIQGTTSYYGISPNDTFYPQAEADKVIAELKGDNERLRGESCKLTDGCLRLKQCRKEKANIADELRHHKYKRCLAMAAVCFEKSYSTTLVKYDKESGLLRNFYDWWGKRWLALAEKFKPNN